ncbi:hypothetical protein GCU67_11355 [Modestobacter muralis]|uniref:Uncharacterized protein n=1 Tax=Modestobacter muralis TaxID=1608614 RepID=A0A6P0H7I6_9ACTN|nr:hypothetical protein [Modestobacter muralis]NEK94762.1 hypothetical protein [Modestobacter muralis]NEN51650.1 hypothetical protein [Modestobacter muralis]
MPPPGSVSEHAGASLLPLGGAAALFVVAAVLLALVIRLLIRMIRSTAAADEPPPPPPRPAPSPPRVAGPATPRPAAAGHHPVGRRSPGTGAQRAVTGPRRPLQVVAADLRRLTGELSMVPGGLSAERRRDLLAAYDDVLMEAADLLQVPHRLRTEPPATRELERLRLLSQLEAAGLVVSG